MKASVKLRGEAGNQPLLRAKVPVNIFGIPFSSGMSLGFGDGNADDHAGDELALHLGTLFDVGPSARLSYKPRTSSMSMLLKAGLGSWGSPKDDGGMVMAAEVGLTTGGLPSFSLHFRPQLGNFSLRKDAFQFLKAKHDHGNVRADQSKGEEKVGSPVSSQGSSLVMVGSSATSSQDGDDAVDEPVTMVNRENAQTMKMPSSKGGWGLGLVAHTGVPLGRHALAKVRWKVQRPSTEVENIWSIRRLPVLVLDKLSIQACNGVPKGRHPRRGFLQCVQSHFGGGDDGGELGKVASVCSSIKRQLHLLYAENRMLMKTMEDMKADMCGRNNGGSSDHGNGGPSKPYMVLDDDMQRQVFNRDAKSNDVRGDLEPSSSVKTERATVVDDVDDVSEQLKKAIMSSTKQ